MKEYPLAIRYLVWIMLTFALVTVLSITRQLLVPLFFSVFMAYLLFPAARWLERKGVPRIGTNFIVILSFMIIIFGVIFSIFQLSDAVMKDLPELKRQFSQNISELQGGIEATLGVTIQQQNTFVKTTGLNGDYFSSFLQSGRNTLIALALIPVYTFMLLFYRNKFRDFISMVVKEENEETAQDIIDKAANVVPKYLKGLFVVCVILVGLNSLGFYIIDVEYPLLFGIIAAVFNLIPYLGTVIGYGIVFILVFGIQSPGIATAVIIQFIIVQFIENNILTPNITGSYVRINPLVIIFSLIAGGLIWGLPGMFLVIPTLGILKIVCESVDSLKPYAFLLGTQGTEKYSITMHAVRRKFGWED